MSSYVVYHDNCPDGFTAFWVTRRLTSGWSVAPGVPANYGNTAAIDAIPDGSDILFLDFCMSADEMMALALRSKTVKVLDHHKTARDAMKVAEDAFPLNFTAHFDMNRSGAGLAWDNLQSGVRPKLVAYVEDRDLWRFKLPGSKALNAYIMAQPRTLKAWNDLYVDLSVNISPYIERGEAILQANAQHMAQAVLQAKWVDIGGANVPVVNSSMLTTDLGNTLLELYPDAPFAGYYFDRADGKRQFGLRSRKGGADVAVIAGLYGGGGHPQAAGFSTDSPFVL